MGGMRPPLSLGPSQSALGPLLAALALMTDGQRSAVLHVTAAWHGEGTTTVAREIAAAAASRTWCQVAFVDAAPISETNDAPSLLALQARGAEPTFGSGRIGASSLAIGRLTGPGEGAPRLDDLRALFDLLRRRFAVTVIDCPPVLPCRESAVIGTVADGTVLVVEAERTRRADIASTREALDRLGATVLGSVLNRRRQVIPTLIEPLM
jgi:Mrp family chromosome partitioning ATPase